VEDTLQSIREGKLAISDLPPIQVIPLGNDEYVSLNNRRLWVFQECGKLGICDTVGVRVRQPKSQAERERYSVDKCALSTTFMREKPKQQLDIPDDEEEPEAAKPSQSLTTSFKEERDSDDNDVDDKIIGKVQSSFNHFNLLDDEDESS